MNILIPYINSLHNQLPYILPYTAYFAPHLPTLAPHLPQLIPHFPHLLPYLPESQAYIAKLVPHTKSFLPYLKDIEQNISLIIPNLPFIVANLDDFLPYLDSLCPHMSYFLPFLGKVEEYYPALKSAGIHKFLANVEDFVPDLGIIVANLKYIVPELSPSLTTDNFELVHRYAQIIMKEFGWGLKYTSKYLSQVPAAIQNGTFPELLNTVHTEKMRVLGLEVQTKILNPSTTTNPPNSGRRSSKVEIAVEGPGLKDSGSGGSGYERDDGLGDSRTDSTMSGDLASYDGVTDDEEEDERSENGSVVGGERKKRGKRQRIKNFFHRKGHKEGAGN
eukprot:TRINITY_DN6180_c0_g1_i1.p1 TRINITY_DN6180_c0_g1~~TRINITY_DN6180_c0_g1_i1.p1  ORF type:complete len:333 (-),score=106.79 TRINITY_DN6180_c0_g1_i1:118-1116(-)